MADEASKELTTGHARRTGPLQFFQEVRRETSKVTWPSWRETYLTTIMVLIFVVVTMVFFAVVDYGLGLALNLVLGVR
jgi:preprotein translocase subunit SecE